MSNKINHDIIMQGNGLCKICNKSPRLCSDPVNHGDPDWEEDEDD